MGILARRSTVCSLTAAATVLAATVLAATAVGDPTAAGAQTAVDPLVKEAELSPSDVTAGDEVTVSSVGHGCVSNTRARLVWAVFPQGDFVWGEQLGWKQGDAIASGEGSPQNRGTIRGKWSVTFPAPDLGDGPPSTGEIGPGSPTSVRPTVYGPLPFTVDGHELEFVAKCYEPAPAGELVLSPEVPEAGGTATLTTDDPCPMPLTQGGWVSAELWTLIPSGGFRETLATLVRTDLGPVEVADDGSWSTTFDVPDDPDLLFGLDVDCRNAEGGMTRVYLLHPFDVRLPDGSTTEAPTDVWDQLGDPSEVVATASPATPVPGDPDYTG